MSDFTGLAGVRHPWQVAALQEQLSRGPLLLTGTSYRESDIRQWLNDVTAADEGLRDRLTTVLSRAALNLSREEFAGVRQAIVNQREAIGFQVVVTDDYADGAQLLSEIAWRTLLPADDYLPPNRRAADLWQAHTSQFSTLPRSGERVAGRRSFKAESRTVRSQLAFAPEPATPIPVPSALLQVLTLPTVGQFLTAEGWFWSVAWRVRVP